jgi:hypothetical protein
MKKPGVVKRAQETKKKKPSADQVTIDIYGTPQAVRIGYGDGEFSFSFDTDFSDRADALCKLGPIVRRRAELSDAAIEKSGLLDQFITCCAELRERAPIHCEDGMQERVQRLLDETHAERLLEQILPKKLETAPSELPAIPDDPPPPPAETTQEAARELLWLALSALQESPLKPAAVNEYLVNSIQRILDGQDANRALGIHQSAGRPKTPSEDTITILAHVAYQQRQQLRKSHPEEPERAPPAVQRRALRIAKTATLRRFR